MKEIRVGIAGSGFAASFHYESIMQSGLPDIKIQGVYSKTFENREGFAKDREIKAYGSMSDMLEDINVVH
ncbi:MAG: Gfo/Idh/MocA family oxidoreductase, partial [Spirochaetales bacterium]|nr:Gfo/Idh/MocA family oxidoreductase [Spirochaetales bacterium]